MQKIFLAAFVCLLCFTSCKKDQDEEDRELIEQYLVDNNLTAQSLASGLYYIIEEAGSGGAPTTSNEVEVYYKGSLLNGTVFDQRESTDDPLAIQLASTIQGWQEGIPLFEKGGKGMLFIPSALGYGSRSVGNIPANSVLIFEVELVDFN